MAVKQMPPVLSAVTCEGKAYTSKPSIASSLDLEKNNLEDSSNNDDTPHSISVPTSALSMPPHPTHAPTNLAIDKPTTDPLDWEGPDDPDNPHNWSLAKKIHHTASPALCGFAVTLASSIISPAHPLLEKSFNISSTTALLPLALYVLGLGFGPTLAAGPSETFGRAVVFKACMTLFMLFILGSALSRHFALLVVMRFLAGFCGGPVLAVGSGTLADLFSPQKRAVMSAGFLTAPFLGPALGPVLGGLTAQYKTWPWTQYTILFLTIPICLILVPTKETYKKIILARRHKARQQQSPSPPIAKPNFASLLKITLFRPLQMLVSEPIVCLFSLYTAFNFSLLFAFFAAYPYVFHTFYGFSTVQSGLTFLGIGLGVLLATVTGIVVDRLVYQRIHKREIQKGRSGVRPEERLYTAMIGSFGIPIGLFMFGWSVQGDVHWIVPVLAGVPFAWGNLCVFLSCMLYLIDVYGPLNGASASAANGVLRYTLGAVFPLFTLQMYRNLGPGWATSLLAFISVVLLFVPWVFYIWGPKIRAKSAYSVAQN